MAANCSEPGCENPVRSNGLCNTCYARHWRHGTLPPRTRNVGTCNQECSVPECDNLVGRSGARGLCPKHYYRLRETGTLDQPARTASLEVRFRAMVSTDPCPCGCECELWTGGIHPRTGYGHFTIGNKTYLAHRVAYELAEGKPVPEGLVIDHVYEKGCVHRNCVKRSHLEPVTRLENNHRMFRRYSERQV